MLCELQEARFLQEAPWLQKPHHVNSVLGAVDGVKKGIRNVPRVFQPVVNGERRFKSEFGVLIFNFFNCDFIVKKK